MHEKDAFTLLLIYAALPLYTIGIWILGFGTAKLTQGPPLVAPIVSEPRRRKPQYTRRDSWDIAPQYSDLEDDAENGYQSRGSVRPLEPVHKARIPSTANVYGQSKSHESSKQRGRSNV